MKKMNLIAGMLFVAAVLTTGGYTASANTASESAIRYTATSAGGMGAR